MRRRRPSVVLTLLVLTGCSRPAAGPIDVSDLPAVVCTVAYRSAVTEPLDDQDEITLEPGERDTVSFDDLEVDLIYDASPQEGGALRVDASEPGAEGLLVRNLYQLPGSDPLPSFVGGTGFTGLVYVYPPGSDAEAQYFCAADGS